MIYEGADPISLQCRARGKTTGALWRMHDPHRCGQNWAGPDSRGTPGSSPELAARRNWKIYSCPGPFTISFCIAEGFLALPSTLFDGSGTPWVRRILEKWVPTTHSSVTGMEICRHKDETYQVLAANNIRVPAHFIIRPDAGSIDQQLMAIEEMMHFPSLSNPVPGQQHWNHRKSIVSNPESFNCRCTPSCKIWENSLSVETYLSGQEYTIGIVGNEEKRFPHPGLSP